MKKLIPSLLMSFVLSASSLASARDVSVDIKIGNGVKVDVDVKGGSSSDGSCVVKRCRWGIRWIFIIPVPWRKCTKTKAPSCGETPAPGPDKPAPPEQPPGEGEEPPQDKPDDQPKPPEPTPDQPTPDEKPAPEESPTDTPPGDTTAQFTAEDLKGYLETRNFVGQAWKVIGPETDPKFPGGKAKSPGHDNSCTAVSVNDKAVVLFPDDGNATERVFEAGAVIVKADHSAGKNGNSLAAMKKVSRESGDWIFAEVEVEGQTATIKNQGKIETCQNCHQNHKDFDFVPSVEMWKNLKNKISTGNVFQPCDQTKGEQEKSDQTKGDQTQKPEPQ